jgi:hypothetical protein
MTSTTERVERRGGERRILDGCVGVLLEETLEPPGSNSAMAARVFLCDQRRELEQLDEGRMADLAQRHLSPEQTAALDARW